MSAEQQKFPIEDIVASQVLGGEFDGPSDAQVQHVQNTLSVGEEAARMIIDTLQAVDDKHMADQLNDVETTL